MFPPPPPQINEVLTDLPRIKRPPGRRSPRAGDLPSAGAPGGGGGRGGAHRGPQEARAELRSHTAALLKPEEAQRPRAAGLRCPRPRGQRTGAAGRAVRGAAAPSSPPAAGPARPGPGDSTKEGRRGRQVRADSPGCRGGACRLRGTDGLSGARPPHGASAKAAAAAGPTEAAAAAAGAGGGSGTAARGHSPRGRGVAHTTTTPGGQRARAGSGGWWEVQPAVRFAEGSAAPAHPGGPEPVPEGAGGLRAVPTARNYRPSLAP